LRAEKKLEKGMNGTALSFRLEKETIMRKPQEATFTRYCPISFNSDVPCPTRFFMSPVLIFSDFQRFFDNEKTQD